METSLVRLRAVKTDTEKQVSEHYRAIVQEREKLSDNEWQLQFCRGVVDILGQVEVFMTEGDLPQSLLRVQNLRIDTYCELSTCYETKVLCEKKLEKSKKDLYFAKGRGDRDKLLECYETLDVLGVMYQDNEDSLHFKRGAIEGLNEAERTINEELNPKVVPSKLLTSPGVIGPELEGHAMPRPSKTKIRFPSYEEQNALPNAPSEYIPGRYDNVSIEEAKTL